MPGIDEDMLGRRGGGGGGDSWNSKAETK